MTISKIDPLLYWLRQHSIHTECAKTGQAADRIMKTEQILRELIAIVEIDDEFCSPGTGAYTVLQSARAILNDQ